MNSLKEMLKLIELKHISQMKYLIRSLNTFKTLQNADSIASYITPIKNSDTKTLKQIFAIQPVIKGQERSNGQELCALIESIPLWKVSHKLVQPLRRIDHNRVFGTGKMEEITEQIRKMRHEVNGVVIGINTLTSNQLLLLEKQWKLPVYDRFSVILEIFRARATTNEAKVQVALAEISYLSAHLRSICDSGMEHHKEALEMLGGSGETFINTRKHILRERKARIEKDVAIIAEQKGQIRSHHKKVEIPVVAVVGYTNAGKTSLIQCLTGDRSIKGEDRLFATLDVNSFEGYLNKQLKVLYMDTIGFISDIPHSLFAAFHASLSDISYADVIIVVSDCSHPEKTVQDAVVLETLHKITHKLPEDKLIFVHNKADLMREEDRLKLENTLGANGVIVSLVEGWGVERLEGMVQSLLAEKTGRIRRGLRVPINSSLLPWLYKEATVEEVVSDPKDPQVYLMKVSMTPNVDAKFSSKFKKK